MTDTMPLPPVIRIEPASACNLKCTHCPTGVLPMARTIMKPALFDRALEQVSLHVPPIRVAVLYHGGEPFLNKRFLLMARRVKDTGIAHVKAVSNGMLIKPAMHDAIVDCGLDAIEISLDAESPAENDRIRVNCDFEHVNATVHGLVAANKAQGRPLQITVSSTQFQTLKTYGADREAPVPSYLRDAFADIAEEIDFKTTWAMQWPSQAPSAGYDILWDDSRTEKITNCSLIDDTMSIRANGDVVPCCFDLTSLGVMGNIQDSSLAEIWNGDAYRQFRADFAAARYPRLCQECVFVTGNKFLLRPEGDGEGGQRIIPISSLNRQAATG